MTPKLLSIDCKFHVDFENAIKGPENATHLSPTEFVKNKAFSDIKIFAMKTRIAFTISFLL